MTPRMEQVVNEFFLKEVKLRQVSSPYTIAEVEAAAGVPIQTSPLRVVPKGDPILNKWRICKNLSWPWRPRGDIASVNWGLDSSFEKCTWTSTAQLEALFRDFDSDVTVMGLDVIEGFHQIPINALARTHLCLSWRGSIWIRKVACFGACTTPAIFGNLIDASLAMLCHQFPVQAVSQVDNIAIARKGESVQDSTVRNFFRKLGWPVHPEEAAKGFTWSRRFTHNGIIWDLDAKLKSLAEPKRLKYLAFTWALLKTGSATLTDMEKILGYLVYTCSEAKNPTSSTSSPSAEASATPTNRETSTESSVSPSRNGSPSSTNLTSQCPLTSHSQTSTFQSTPTPQTPESASSWRPLPRASNLQTHGA
ncbi:hypothetical protein P7C70_g8565, partial [Phenoliferia sp. Uapishka_3]